MIWNEEFASLNILTHRYGGLVNKLIINSQNSQTNVIKYKSLFAHDSGYFFNKRKSLYNKKEIDKKERSKFKLLAYTSATRNIPVIVSAINDSQLRRSIVSPLLLLAKREPVKASWLANWHSLWGIFKKMHLCKLAGHITLFNERRVA